MTTIIPRSINDDRLDLLRDHLIVGEPTPQEGEAQLYLPEVDSPLATIHQPHPWYDMLVHVNYKGFV